MSERKRTMIEMAVEELHKRGGHVTSNPASKAMVIACTDGNGHSKQFTFEATALYTCPQCSEDLYAEFETPAPTGKLTLRKIEQTITQAASRGDTELLAVREFQGQIYFALTSQGHCGGWKGNNCGTLCLPPGPQSAVSAVRLVVDMLASHDKKLRGATAKLQDRALLAIRQLEPERLAEGLRRVAEAAFSTEVLKSYLSMARSPIEGAPPVFLMKLDQLRPGYGADTDTQRIQRMVGVLQEIVSAARAVKLPAEGAVNTLTAGAPGVS